MNGESLNEIILDNTNKVSLPGFPYTFEALGEQILVAVDTFRSGYECQTCKGKGTVKHQCSCVRDKHVGFRYGEADIQLVRDTLGFEVAKVRSEMVCPECSGEPTSVAQEETCPACQGKQSLLHIPDSAKQLPVTGVVVSMGVKARELCTEYKVGDRILTGFHTGSMIPTRSGVMFKRMDWYSAWLRIEGADELGAFEFVISE